MKAEEPETTSPVDKSQATKILSKLVPSKLPVLEKPWKKMSAKERALAIRTNVDLTKTDISEAVAKAGLTLKRDPTDRELVAAALY